MSVNQRLFKSTFLLFAGRFINRFIGLISTLILARLLVPDDFGIVAAASIVIFFFEAISNVGIWEYLTHKTELTKDDINTAWTLNALTKLIVWLIFLLCIPLIVDFYDRDELYPVLFLVSFTLPLIGLENVGLILSQRELNYTPLFVLRLAEKVISFLILLFLLIFMKSYWVMVISLVSSYVVRIIGSYIIDPYRPKLCFINIKEQWDFSKWLLPKGIIGFMKSELDTIFVSKLYGFASLGGFNLMKSLISMIGRDIIQPATDPLLAAFSSVKTDTERLSFQVLMSIWVITVVMTPVVGYTYGFSDIIVGVLYGPQWLEYSIILEALAPLIIIFATTGVLLNLLTSQARVKQLFYFEVAALISMAAILSFVPLESLEEFSLVRTLVSIFFWVVLLAYANYVVSFSVLRLFALSIPLTIAGYFSYLVTISIPLSNDINVILELLITGTSYVVSYIIAVFILLTPFRQCAEVSYFLWFLDQNVWSKLRHRFTRK